MKAIILAAGMGKRLAQYTKDQTKCMVEVCGVSLIERLLNQISRHNLDEIVIVTGYKKDTLMEHIKSIISKNSINVPIKYIENKDYDTTNNIYSLYLTHEEMINNDIILFESDLIFDDKIIDRVFNSEYENFALVASYEEWMDGTVVTLGEENHIQSFIGRDKFSYTDKDKYYKTANIYRISKEFSKNKYIPFLEAYIKSTGKNEYYEQVLSVIISMGTKEFRAEIIDDAPWYEIDDANDLNIASTLFADDKERLQQYFKRYGGYWRFKNLIDYCYLVNPYFPPKNMLDEFINSFRTLLINYPSGMMVNRSLAATMFSINEDYITVGNGAAELIRELMQYNITKTGVIVPTFEEYSNSMPEENVVRFNTFNNNFSYNANDIIKFVEDNEIKRMVIIAPDNPTGYLIPHDEIVKVLEHFKNKDIRIIFDESFIDFADTKNKYTMISNDVLEKYKNLVVIKSISKSYGVPGLRLGILASSDTELCNIISKKCSIWNINSFGEFFMQIIGKYKKDYEKACTKLAEIREKMYNGLNGIAGLYVFKSQANYLLCKITLEEFDINHFMTYMLDNKLFIKDCSSKKGFLQGTFIRLAIRTEEENNLLIDKIKEYMQLHTGKNN